MGQEIERKFKVIGDTWRSLGTGSLYRQGYIPTVDERTVRVRLVGEQGYLTLKGPATGMVRPEFEYPIPAQDAIEILDTLCTPPLIEKIRYRVPIQDLTWEIDEFLGTNSGLILAEVELTHASQALDLPPWVGEEVTDDPRYFNVNLAQHPFQTWGLP
jgi:adenylate cyclase